MDQNTLVSRNEKDGRRLTRALKKNSRFGLVASFWWFDPDSERWSLVIASRLYRLQGPKAAYSSVAKQIAKLESKRTQGSFIGLGSVTIVSDEDPKVQAMGSAMRIEDSDARIQSSNLNGVFVADALVYELGRTISRDAIESPIPAK